MHTLPKNHLEMPHNRFDVYYYCHFDLLVSSLVAYEVLSPNPLQLTLKSPSVSLA